ERRPLVLLQLCGIRRHVHESPDGDDPALDARRSDPVLEREIAEGGPSDAVEAAEHERLLLGAGDLLGALGGVHRDRGRPLHTEDCAVPVVEAEQQCGELVGALELCGLHQPVQEVLRGGLLPQHRPCRLDHLSAQTGHEDHPCALPQHQRRGALLGPSPDPEQRRVHGVAPLAHRPRPSSAIPRGSVSSSTSSSALSAEIASLSAVFSEARVWPTTSTASTTTTLTLSCPPASSARRTRSEQTVRTSAGLRSICSMASSSTSPLRPSEHTSIRSPVSAGISQ